MNVCITIYRAYLSVCVLFFLSSANLRYYLIGTGRGNEIVLLICCECTMSAAAAATSQWNRDAREWHTDTITTSLLANVVFVATHHQQLKCVVVDFLLLLLLFGFVGHQWLRLPLLPPQTRVHVHSIRWYCCDQFRVAGGCWEWGGSHTAFASMLHHML